MFSVREAKAQLSALVGRAAKGEEVVITWHGQPKARLAPMRTGRALLTIDRRWLSSQPVPARGPRTEQLVRAERDAKG